MARVFVKGADKVAAKFRALETRSRGKNKVSIVVGYTANYALYVHENVEMKWKGKPRKGKGHRGNYWDPPGRGQAKYLEQPFREHHDEIYNQALKMTRATGSLETGLLQAGRFLQRLSQQLVPVDIGNLKASAFTEKE